MLFASPAAAEVLLADDAQARELAIIAVRLPIASAEAALPEAREG